MQFLSFGWKNQRLIAVNLIALFDLYNYVISGVEPAIVDEKGNEMHGECEGYLCIKNAWPGMLRNIYGDYDRY